MASAWAVIEDNGLILMVQRSCNTSRPSQWCLPGGGIRTGELPEQACVREVREETGLLVRVSATVLIDGGQCYFRCQLDSERHLQLQASECQASAWVRPEQWLGLGVIMEMRRVSKVLASLGYAPEQPSGA